MKVPRPSRPKETGTWQPPAPGPSTWQAITCSHFNTPSAFRTIDGPMTRAESHPQSTDPYIPYQKSRKRGYQVMHITKQVR